MLNVTVKRSQWLRGEGPKGSKLLRSSDNKMCCMGFASIVAGISKEFIEDHGTVGDVCLPEFKDIPESLWLFQREEHTTRYAIYGTNDNERLTDEEREAKLKALGEQVGIKFDFED